jgi:NlpC/P60 family putative phage cell wall peptidase
VRTADPDRVVAAARSWLGTPYHDQASLKGVGCDCLGLTRGVWRDVVGPEPFLIPPYSRDWGEIGSREILAEGARAMMIEVPPGEAPPGALVLFRMMPLAAAHRLRLPVSVQRLTAEWPPSSSASSAPASAWVSAARSSASRVPPSAG